MVEHTKRLRDLILKQKREFSSHKTHLEKLKKSVGKSGGDGDGDGDDTIADIEFVIMKYLDSDSIKEEILDDKFDQVLCDITLDKNRKFSVEARFLSIAALLQHTSIVLLLLLLRHSCRFPVLFCDRFCLVKDCQLLEPCRPF